MRRLELNEDLRLFYLHKGPWPLSSDTDGYETELPFCGFKVRRRQYSAKADDEADP